MKLPKGLWKLSEVCCHKCHLPLAGIFVLSNYAQTSPLELIPFTWSSQLSCGFPPESQKSSAYPSACLTHKCACACLHILTLWLQPGLLCYLGTSFAAFSPRILFPLPYFPILKLTLISLSLLGSQYFKQVICAEEKPKRRKLLKCRSSPAVSEERKGGRKERERLVLKSLLLLPPVFFSGACINPVSATAGNKVTPETEAYAVSRE